VKFRKAFWPLLLAVVLVGVLFAGVFPTRTFLSQRASISHAQKQLSVLDQQTAALQRRAQELQTDSEIERLAREQYNLVKPGEEAYAVLPPPSAKGQETPKVSVPVKKDDGNIVERAWHTITGLF
jgi:cell division protein FtsB